MKKVYERIQKISGCCRRSVGSCKDRRGFVRRCVKGVRVLERNYVVLVMEGIRHGDAILVDIRRKRIFLCTWYFSPYLIPPELGILKE